MVLIIPMHEKSGLKIRKISSNSEFSKYKAYAEYRAEKAEGIYIRYAKSAISGTFTGQWSYFSDFRTITEFYWPDGIKLNDIYDVAFQTDDPLDVVILSDGLNMDIDLDEGRKLPKIIIENGVTFKFNLPTDKTYYFTNPIDLKGGTIEFTNSAIVRGLNIVGEGKVIINNGNYTGTLGDNVILQISGGSADFNDNGKAVDANGNSVHKYTYVARGAYGNEFIGNANTRQPPYDDFYGYNHSEIFHDGNKLHLWLKSQDSIYGVNAFKIKADGTQEDENTYFNLRYGTNILEHRIPFDPITVKYFVVKKGDIVMLKTMENEPSSLQESDIRVEWYSVENDERTKINAHGTSLYAGRMGNSDNGKHYQADVYYSGWDSKLSHSYTYDAYIFIDEPVFTAPDEFHLDKKAKFEVTNNTPNGAVWLNYLWEVSKDDGKTFADVTEADGTFSLDSKVVDGKEEWSTTFTTCATNISFNGYMYRCTVKNAENADYVGTWVSEKATLTVIRNCAVDGHIFDEGTIISEPTCIDKGVKRFNCSECSQYKDETIKPLGHDWKEATCTAPKTCKRCQATEGEPIEHSFGDYISDENGHWKQCSECGTDETCPLGDYEFTFALPEGCTDVTVGFRFAGDGTELAFTAKDDLYTAKVSASDLESGTMTVYASAKLKDGFVITGEKEVTVLENHVGGTATCTEKAKCKFCNKEYGDIDQNNHGKLTHIDKVDATHDKEGNIEYWYCEECGKYFGDKDGTKEIQKADTITDKLKDTPSDDKKDNSKPDKTKGDTNESKTDSSTADKPKSEQKNPQTGSGSGMSLWLAMLLISGGAAMGIKKKHKK